MIYLKIIIIICGIAAISIAFYLPTEKQLEDAAKKPASRDFIIEGNIDLTPKPAPYRVAKYSDGTFRIEYYSEKHVDAYYLLRGSEYTDIEKARAICETLTEGAKNREVHFVEVVP